VLTSSAVCRCCPENGVLEVATGAFDMDLFVASANGSRTTDLDNINTNINGETVSFSSPSNGTYHVCATYYRATAANNGLLTVTVLVYVDGLVAFSASGTVNTAATEGDSHVACAPGGLLHGAC
jgi:hypothetical protein